MNEYLTDLYNAFDRVDSSYYFTEAIVQPASFFDEHISKRKYIQQTELMFTAELHSELRVIMKRNRARYHGLRIGIEVTKRFIENRFFKTQESFKPDLIVHQSQLFFDPEMQKLYVEIKTNSSLNAKTIGHDIKKIVFALMQYQFSNGVFISVNCKYDRLIRLIQEVITNIERIDSDVLTYWQDIYLFYGNVDGNKQSISFAQIRAQGVN